MFEQIDELLQRHELKKAEKLIARLLPQSEPQTQAQLYLYRARTRLFGARPESAIEDLTRARELAPSVAESPAALELYGDALFAQFELATVVDRGDALQAEAIYRRLIDSFPDYANLGWVYFQLARVLLSGSRIDEAADLLERALLVPGQVPALTAYCYERLGFVSFYEKRDDVRALNYLTRAIDTYPTMEDPSWLVQVYLLKCRILRETGDRLRAITEVDAAVRVAARTRSKTILAEALLARGELLSQLNGRDAEVIENLERFLQVSRRPKGADVTFARVHEMLADAYVNHGHFDHAISAYHTVLHFNPNHPWETSIYHRIGRAYYLKGSYDKAVQAVKRALTVAAENDEMTDYQLYDTFGNALFALGQYRDAADAYEHALNMKPSNQEHLQKIQHYHRLSLQLLQQSL
jgi:tetratricopeptide (TPR) repeat protein